MDESEIESSNSDSSVSRPLMYIVSGPKLPHHGVQVPAFAINCPLQNFMDVQRAISANISVYIISMLLQHAPSTSI